MTTGGVLPKFRADPRKSGAEYRYSSQPGFQTIKGNTLTQNVGANLLTLGETRKGIKLTAHFSFLSLNQLGGSVRSVDMMVPESLKLVSLTHETLSCILLRTSDGLARWSTEPREDRDRARESARETDRQTDKQSPT